MQFPNTIRRNALPLAIAGMLVSGVAGAQLGSLLKGGGVTLVVTKFAPQINRAIDAVTFQKGKTGDVETKVVPVLTLGSGGYIGAVQVAGPIASVDQTVAVAQLEGNFKIPLLGGIRLRGLVPVSSKDITKGIHRVNGVGVSALIDVRL